MELKDAQARRGALLAEQYYALLSGDKLDPSRLPTVSALRGVPLAHVGLLPSDLSPTEAAFASGFSDTPSDAPGAMLIGTMRAASRIAAATLNHALKRGTVGRWIEFAEWSEWTRSRFDMSQRPEEYDQGDLWDWYSSRDDMWHVLDLLVINDLRAGPITSFIAEELWRLLSIRQSRSLRTLVVVRSSEVASDVALVARDAADYLAEFDVLDVGGRA
jgi:hypothetical protein